MGKRLKRGEVNKGVQAWDSSQCQHPFACSAMTCTMLLACSSAPPPHPASGHLNLHQSGQHHHCACTSAPLHPTRTWTMPSSPT